jgi:hypothetical protein
MFIFWIPSFIAICVLFSISYIAYKFCRDKDFRDYSFRLGFNSERMALCWIINIINFFVEENEMAKIFGIKPGTPYEYVIKEQEKDPEEDQTKWLLKPLDVSEAAEVSDMIYSAKGFGKKREEQLKSGTQQLEILKRGLVGWINFVYPDGTEVEFEETTSARNRTEKHKIMERNLNKVPAKIRDELADEIRGTSSLDQD